MKEKHLSRLNSGFQRESCWIYLDSVQNSNCKIWLVTYKNIGSDSIFFYFFLLTASLPRARCKLQLLSERARRFDKKLAMRNMN
jgi:hypothetical protein